MANEPRFVYVLRSIDNPDRYYTGVTTDVQHRLGERYLKTGSGRAFSKKHFI